MSLHFSKLNVLLKSPYFALKRFCMRKLAFVSCFFLVAVVIVSFKNKSFDKRNSLTEFFSSDTIHYPAEKHFANVQQLTFGGDNAEAYFSMIVNGWFFNAQIRK